MTIPDEAVQAAHSAYLECVFLTEEQVISSLKKMLTAALPFLTGVKVKALEWREIDLRVGNPSMMVWEAKTPFMTYSLESVMDRPWFCSFICAHFSDLDAAKSASQADYEARILSAIEVLGNSEQLNLSPRAQALEEAAQAAENAVLSYNIADCAGLADWKAFEAGQESGLVHAASAIRALSSKPVAEGWFPIETAPKDGTPFLVFVPDDKFSDGTGIDVIWYDEEQWLFGSNTPFVPANNPTHWRPLPASPGASE